MINRETPDIAFVEAVQRMVPGPRRDLQLAVRSGSALSGARALELFGAQMTSRHLDFAARWLKAEGAGFYTIGSAGHEGNAAVAAVTTPADPALLHYRSGAFFVERARQRSGVDAVRDILLGVVAGAEEPISGGRHKVFGSRALEVIPQTSTIASHLPRAVGLAFAIERASRLGVTSASYRPPAIVVASFGDASANHSTLTGAIQSACHCAHQQLPLPILFVCEDNGLGISVETPPHWIHAAYGTRKDLAYFAADGCDLAAAFDAAVLAATHVRERRRPAFLHLRMVRLMGHAGSDAETAYRAPERIREELARDPLVSSARLIVEAGFCTPIELIEKYEITRRRVMETALAPEPGSCAPRRRSWRRSRLEPRSACGKRRPGRRPQRAGATRLV